ncbi:MAG: hypothetical protein RL514_3964 [Verrucomicrobiota bacterium]|jgi:hypothetical protein
MPIEPTTAVGGGLVVLGSKDLLNKVLGPTADYLGGELKNFVQKCNINLDNVLKKALEKLGDRVNEPGGVNPRVLKGVLEEGRFCEDELMAEYYGGVLASARTPLGRDDRGVALLTTIRSLSVYQIRTHFIAYLIANRLYRGQSWNLADATECHDHTFWIPFDVYLAAMAFNDQEDANSILSHAFFGLSRLDLVCDFSFGSPEYLKRRHPHIPKPGIIVGPTILGAELFCWALGITGASGRELLSFEPKGDSEIAKVPDGSLSLKLLKHQAPTKEAGLPENP